MEPSDFSSALFGPVIRFRATHWVLGRSRRGLWRYDPETRNRVSASTVGLIGELRSPNRTSTYAAGVPDERFGHRLRPWLEHIAHTISIPMAEECSMIWGRELKEVCLHDTFQPFVTDSGAVRPPKSGFVGGVQSITFRFSAAYTSWRSTERHYYGLC